MARAEAILASVRRIHDASLTADGWQPALQSITQLLNADHAILLASDRARPKAALATSFGMDSGGLARFASPEAMQWLAPIIQAVRPGTAVMRSRMMPDQQFERTGFYNDIVRPAGGFYALGVGHQMPTLSAFFNVCRPKRAGDFEAGDITIMQMLSPHFDTALRVRQRLGVADLSAKTAWEALDRLNTGVIVVDAEGAAVFVNKTAERLFAFRNLQLDDGGICVRDAATHREMRRLIAGCTKAPFDGSGTIANAELRITVAPFQTMRADAGFADQRLALLLVSDLAQERRERVATLQRRFGLTSAEASFALEIANGDGRAAAAARSNITLGTARSHLERIFQKTGVRRQAELVRLLLLSGEQS